MNPDEEWRTWQEWLGREPRGRNIYAEIVEMLAFRKLWWGFAIVYRRAPEQARKNATFSWWINWNYARSMGSAIRRQVDIGREEGGREVISLGRLIERVWRYPTVLTRERYLSLRGEDDRKQAGHWFNANLGPGAFINPEVPARDSEHLRAESADVRRWVNTAVAHFGRRQQKPPPIGDIHHCVDVIFELFHKYARLIQGVEVMGDVVMTPWPTIFRTAWIPEEDWSTVLKEIDAKTGR